MNRSEHLLPELTGIVNGLLGPEELAHGRQGPLRSVQPTPTVSMPSNTRPPTALDYSKECLDELKSWLWPRLREVPAEVAVTTQEPNSVMRTHAIHRVMLTVDPPSDQYSEQQNPVYTYYAGDLKTWLRESSAGAWAERVRQSQTTTSKKLARGVLLALRAADARPTMIQQLWRQLTSSQGVIRTAEHVEHQLEIAVAVQTEHVYDPATRYWLTSAQEEETEAEWFAGSEVWRMVLQHRKFCFFTRTLRFLLPLNYPFLDLVERKEAEARNGWSAPLLPRNESPLSSTYRPLQSASICRRTATTITLLFRRTVLQPRHEDQDDSYMTGDDEPRAWLRASATARRLAMNKLRLST